MAEAAGSVEPGRWLRGRGWRSGDWSPAVEPTRQALDAITGDTPTALMARDYHSLWLNSAALAPGGRRSPGRRRRGRGRRRRRADGRPARGVRLAVPRPLPAPVRRRVRGRDARGAPHRRVTRSDRRARQGRVARCAALLAAAGRRGPADAARLAIAAVRLRRSPRGDRLPLRARRRPAPHRLPEGVHGRDARLADRAAAGRLRGRDHEPRGAGRDRARGRSGRLAGRRARDRRPREPRRARCVRGDPRRVGAARAEAADRARAAAGRGGHPAVRSARRQRPRSSSAMLRRIGTSPSGTGQG